MDEAKNKTTSVMNWKDSFRKRPVPMLGLAFGGGILLGAVVSKRKTSSRRIVSNGAHQAGDIWDNVRTAIIGAAATAKLVRTLKRTWHTRTAW
jgi:hypothetical protein